MKTETKIEQGDWGHLVMSRKVYSFTTPRESDWKMITERKEHYGYDLPHDCTHNSQYIVCPHCKHEHEPDSDDYCDGDEYECYECERTFSVSASFGYGWSTEPTECKHHDYVFASQYSRYAKGQWTTWRIMECKNCEEHVSHCLPNAEYEKVNGRLEYVYSKEPIYTLLPWLDEYNDPDFFDPAETLKTGADLNEEYATPILDFLREGYWGKPYGRNNPTHAIEAHEKAYGEL